MAHGGKRPGAGRKPGLASVLAEHTRAYIAQYLNENIEPMIKAIGEKAKKGDVFAFKELYDRAHGKAPQSVDHTSKGEALPTPLYVLPQDGKE
jgi:hypothetical protein